MQSSGVLDGRASTPVPVEVVARGTTASTEKRDMPILTWRVVGGIGQHMSGNMLVRVKVAIPCSNCGSADVKGACGDLTRHRYRHGKQCGSTARFSP